MKKTTSEKHITVRDQLIDYGENTVNGLKRLQQIFAQESSESKLMMEIYGRSLINKASSEELQHANKQFGDLLKTLGLGTLFVLPGGVVTLPLTILAAKKLGIDILPSSFKSKLPPAQQSAMLPDDDRH
jgi:hypothetical protein